MNKIIGNHSPPKRYIPRHEAPSPEGIGRSLRQNFKKITAVLSASAILGSGAYLNTKVHQELLRVEDVTSVSTSGDISLGESEQTVGEAVIGEATINVDEFALPEQESFTLEIKTPQQQKLENFLDEYTEIALYAQSAYQIPHEALIAEAIVASDYGNADFVEETNSFFVELVDQTWVGEKHKMFVNELVTTDDINQKITSNSEFKFIAEDEDNLIKVKSIENGAVQALKLPGELIKLMKLSGVNIQIVSDRPDGLIQIEKPVLIKKFASTDESLLRLAEVMRSKYVGDAILDTNPGWFIGKHAHATGLDNDYANQRLGIINEIRGYENTPPVTFAPPPETIGINPEYYLQDSSQVPCSAGIDRGVRVGYFNHETMPIRICNIAGSVTVNTLLAGNVHNMIQTAKSEGVDLKGWAYRDHEAQVQTRIKNGCPDIDISPPSKCTILPTAIPGESEHENGGAIDWDLTDPNVLPWLEANAHKFGFNPISSEKFHWSWNGE